MTVRLGLPNAAAGLAEDALAVGVGLMLLRRGEPSAAARADGLPLALRLLLRVFCPSVCVYSGHRPACREQAGA